MRIKKIIVVSILTGLFITSLIFFISIFRFQTQPKVLEPVENVSDMGERMFQFIKLVIKNQTADEPLPQTETLQWKGKWKVDLTAYRQGRVLSEGIADITLRPENKWFLTEALKVAVDDLLKNDLKVKELVKENSGMALMMKLTPPVGNSFSFIGFNGEVKKLVDDRNPIVEMRKLDRDIIKRSMFLGQDYLLRVAEHEKEGGFHKYVKVEEEDRLKPKLHTVYTSSIIYAFLFIHDLTGEEKALEDLSKWGDFILMMQNSEDRHYGAFHYSYFFNEKHNQNIKRIEFENRDIYLDQEGRRLRYVVGTSAKTIYTLLRLYEYTGEEKYLTSAIKAGDWLLTMQEKDGTVRPYTHYRDGSWFQGTQESLLYQGQVLSALSRLYDSVGKEEYLEGAVKIADHFMEEVKVAGDNYVGDDYRDPNPISNSWIIMSLLDAYKITENEQYKQIILNRAQRILNDQYNDYENPTRLGQWDGSYSTSGNGWIAEVMVELYRLCEKEEWGECRQYKKSGLKGMRWVIQRTYTKANSFLKKRSNEILGGVMWNRSRRYIRNDSVAHALNAYARILEYLDNDFLLELPESSLKEILLKFEVDV